MRYARAYIAFLLALSLPYLADAAGYRGVIPILAYSWIMSIYALSFSILLGHLGLLSFGHALFLGFGAYVTTYVLLWTGLPYPVAVTAAVIVGALLGLAVAIISRRAFEGIPFAFITLTVQLIVYFLYRKKELASISGGEQGLIAPTPPGLQSPWVATAVLAVAALLSVLILTRLLGEWRTGRASTSLLGSLVIVAAASLGLLLMWSERLSSVPGAFRAMPNLHMISLTVLLGVYVLLDRVVGSPLGAVWRAIRDNEVRASTLGYSVFKYKTLGVVLSGALAALAGALYVPYALNVSPDRVFSPMVSVYALMYSIIGGVFSLTGPILGVVLVETLEMLVAPYVGGYSMVLTGVIFVAVMLYSPEGLAYAASRLRSPFKRARGG